MEFDDQVLKGTPSVPFPANPLPVLVVNTHKGRKKEVSPTIGRGVQAAPSILFPGGDVMFTVVLLALLGQPPGAQPRVNAALPPVQGVASMDARGNLVIARVNPCCFGDGHREVWLKGPDQKAGEKGMIKAKVTQLTVTVVELPAHAVEAYTVDGKAVPAGKLAELLARERTVLVAQNGQKVDPFYLQLYKEGTLVLVPPADLEGMNAGGFPVPGNFPPPEFLPEKKPQLDPPFDKPKPEASVEHLVAAFQGERQDAPDRPPSGGIAAALRVRDRVPASMPPAASTAVLKDGALEVAVQVPRMEVVKQLVAVQVMVMVPVTQEVEVNVNGRIEKRVVTVTKAVPRQEMREVVVHRAVPVFEKRTVAVKSVKSFVVTQQGRLEALDAAQLPEKFKQATPVLIGAGPDVDPRHLELIRPGTVYLVLPHEFPRPEPLPVDGGKKKDDE
jgi:hypothetical protein